MFARLTLAVLAVTLFLSGPPPMSGWVRLVQSESEAAVEEPLDIRGRLHEDLVLRAGERTDVLVVIDGDAIVAGEADLIFVIAGDARLLPTARVNQLYVARGAAELQSGAIVTGEVQLLNATLRMSPGALVGGQVRYSYWSRISRGLRTFGVLIGIGLGIALLLGAGIAVAVAPDAMRHTAATLTGRFGMTLLTAGTLWLILPWLALYVAATVVGLPMGIGFLLFVLPVLAFLGYLVCGVALGSVLTRGFGASAATEKPLLAAFAGTGVLLLIGIIPVLGAVVTAIAVFAGSGAIVLSVGTRLEKKPASPAHPRSIIHEVKHA